MLGANCMVCEAPRKLRQAISGADGELHPDLAKLEAFLLRDPSRAEATVKWATRGSSAKMLRRMANGDLPISLHAVAAQTPSAGMGYFAALLMEAGVVPTENFERVRLEVWEERYFRGVEDPGHARLLRTYARWSVNGLFSDEAHFAKPDQSHRLSRSRRHLKAVHEFLETVKAFGFTLDSLPQVAFDEYVATRGSAARELTSFIRWCRRRHLTTLDSTYLQASVSPPVISEDERWAWLQQLLVSADIPLPSRVAGLLCLSYGIPMTRVLTLRRDAVSAAESSSRTMVRLSIDPIEIPSAMAELLNRLLATPARSPIDQDIWVFRGRRAGRHLSTAAATKPLRARGINVGAGRSAALMSLTREAPPSVLSDLLGVSVTSAERWAKLSAHDWVDYPRLRGMNGA